MSDRLEAIPLDEDEDLEPEGAAGAAAPLMTVRRLPRVPPDLVMPLLQLVLLGVVAVALVVIALQERRQTVVVEREECRQAAYNFRGGDGEFPGGFDLRIEEACGASDPLDGR